AFLRRQTSHARLCDLIEECIHLGHRAAARGVVAPDLFSNARRGLTFWLAACAAETRQSESTLLIPDERVRETDGCPEVDETGGIPTAERHERVERGENHSQPLGQDVEEERDVWIQRRETDEETERS